MQTHALLSQFKIKANTQNSEMETKKIFYNVTRPKMNQARATKQAATGFG